jgi:hypothetical protein
MPWLEARASAEYTRIFSSAHPTLDDTANGYYVAGGALDQYFVMHLGASAIF